MNDPPKSNPTQSLTETFGATRPVLNKLASDYLQSANTYEFSKIQREKIDLHNDETGLLTGRLNLNDVSRTVSIPKSILLAQEEKQKRDKRTTHDQLIMLLNDMRDRLAELDAALAARHKALQEKYGQDVIGGMAATYLSEKELRGLSSDEEKMRGLADKFLDKNGEIKDKYKYLDEAHYVRDWMEAETLRPIVEKYNSLDYLTAAERDEVIDAARSATLSENMSKVANSLNDEYGAVIDTKLNNDSRDVASRAAVNTLEWG